MLLSELFEDHFASVSLFGANGKVGDFGKVFSGSSYVGFYFHPESNTAAITDSAENQRDCQPQQAICQIFLNQARTLVENLSVLGGNGSNAKKPKSNFDHADVSKLSIIFVVVEKIGEDGQAIKLRCGIERDLRDDFVWILPAKEQKAHMQLLQLYKVRSPAFIIVDSKTKRTIAMDGRRALITDPLGRRFPWHLPEPEDIFRGQLVKRIFNNGTAEMVDFSELRGVIKCLFFAAHWCPPCRLFVKQLERTYRQLKDVQSNQMKFEVIFCSLDRCDDTFRRFFADMPWLAFPYNDPRSIAATRLYGIQEVPSLLLLDADNQLITKHGKCELNMDPAGQEFPWYPKVVLELNGYTAYRLREEISVLLFTEGMPEDLVFAQTSLLPVAEDFCARTSTDQQDMLFFYGGDDAVCDQMWENFSLGDASLPLICINDPFANNLYICDDANISEAIIRKFIDKFLTGDLEPTKRLVPLRMLTDDQEGSGISSPQPPNNNSGREDDTRVIGTSKENAVSGMDMSSVINGGSTLSRSVKRYCL